MELALTTRWNAGRHTSGEAMLREILDLGFTHVELGYDLRADLVAGAQKLAAAGAVKVDSLHNFCPLPVGVNKATPEIFAFTDTNSEGRAAAVRHTEKTIRFAAEIGARVVVTHAGYADMPKLTDELLDLYAHGGTSSAAYDKTRQRLLDAREKNTARHLGWLRQGLDQLLPLLNETGVTLAIELLPWWETVPTETEMLNLLQAYNTPRLRCWCDVGHMQIRQNLMQVNARRWLERLQPFVAGYHLHDAQPPARDHLMPPLGQIDFAAMRAVLAPGALLVMEPAPNTDPALIRTGKQHLEKLWGGA
jgi:sugar phosphate isomerase/epimerase